MTDMWFKLKEISKHIQTLESYVEAWMFIRKVASGELSYNAIIADAKALLKHFKKEEEN